VGVLGRIDDVAAALEVARAREFIFARDQSSIDAAQEYVFKHALLHDVIYETVLLRDREPLHRAAARWIERVAGDRVGELLELIAGHYVRANEPVLAARCLFRAGLVARDKGNARAARRALESAIVLMGDADETIPVAVQVAMGELYWRLGDIDAASAMLDAVIAAGDDPGGVADALYWASRVADLRGDPKQEREFLGRALTVAETVGGGAQARVLAGLTYWEAQHGDLDEAEAVGQRAVAAAETGSIEEADAYGGLCVVANLRNDLDEADEYARLAAESARTAGNLEVEATTLTNIGMIAHLRGDAGDTPQYAVADHYYAESYALARRLGVPAIIGCAATNRAQVSVRLGRPVEAARFARESLLCARESKSHADTLYGVIIEADRRASTGAIDDALTLLALAWNDPGTNSLMHQEIERVVSRLDISDSEARSRLSRPPDIDLTSAVEAILDAYA
jgi:tetratricopeptide (TPR) repeat protein